MSAVVALPNRKIGRRSLRRRLVDKDFFQHLPPGRRVLGAVDRDDPAGFAVEHAGQLPRIGIADAADHPEPFASRSRWQVASSRCRQRCWLPKSSSMMAMGKAWVNSIVVNSRFQSGRAKASEFQLCHHSSRSDKKMPGLHTFPDFIGRPPPAGSMGAMYVTVTNAEGAVQMPAATNRAEGPSVRWADCGIAT